MRRTLAYATAIALLGAPLSAQEAGGGSEFRDGAELLSEGMGLILKGLSQELQPLGEGWGEFMTMLGDMTLYYPPEILPNGDILIRRRVPLAPDGAPAPEVDPESGETDL